MALRPLSSLAAAAAAMLLSAPSAASPAGVAAVGSPVSFAVDAAGHTAPHSHGFVEVEVIAYQPSSDGPVTLVVEGSAGAGTVEIGRVGIYPDRPFSASQPERTQRFRLPLPESLPPSRLRSLRLRIEPTLGTGRAARAEVRGRLVFAAEPR